MELFDLTLELGPDLPIEPGDPVLDVARTATHEVQGFEVARICLGSHTGTHIEAPRHFFPEGRTLDSFPLRRLVGRGVVLDCRAFAGKQEGPAEPRHALTGQLRRWPPDEDGIVLLWTEGAPLPLWAAEMLADARVGLLGIDAPSIDEEPYPVHRFLLGRDILIAEGLAGLDRIGPGPIECALLPLSLAGSDAAPARAVAWRSSLGDD